MTDSTIKSLTITGTAVDDAARSRHKALNPTSRKKRSMVKDDEFIETVKLQANLATPIVTPSIQLAKKIPEQPAASPVIPSAPKVENSNVILNPPKQARVKLQPKVSAPVQVPLEHITRKARRIRLTVGNLNHRFTRAKKVKDESEKKPMNTIRDYLVEKGVIQTKSKAPEKMLRSMYSDFMLMKDQAL